MRSSDMLDGQRVTLECPHCRHEFTETVGRLKHDQAVDCPDCHQTIGIAAQGLRDGIKGVERSLADLTRAIEGFGKRR